MGIQWTDWWAKDWGGLNIADQIRDGLGILGGEPIVPIVEDPITAAHRKPLPLWAPAATDGLGCHYHIDQQRFVQVRAMMNQNETIEVPLLTSTDEPMIGTTLPPMITLWWHGTTSSSEQDDPVTDPTSYTWQNFNANAPLLDGMATSSTFVTCSLKLKTSPVRHWALSIDAAKSTTTVNYITACISVLGESAVGAAGAGAVSEGSNWTSGHSRREYIWEDHYDGDANSTGSLDVVNGTLANLNRRKFCRAIGDITNAGTQQTVAYLATPNGLSTDTSVFSTSYVPGVVVMAQPPYAAPYGPATATHATESTWKPWSSGVGFAETAPSPPVSATAATFNVQSLLYVQSSRWRLTSAQTAPAGNRSIMAWAWGR